MAEETDQELGEEAIADDAEISKIKDEIDGTRSQIGETIDELQERLSIPALTAQIKEEVSEQITSAVETTKEVVYDKAIKNVSKIMNKLSELGNAAGGVLPLLLIGAGTGLIVMNSSRKVPLSTKDLRKSPARKDGEGKNVTNNSTLGEVKDAASSAYHRVGDAVSATALRVSDMAAAGKETYVNYYDRNPIAVGSVAAAVGLAIGLALPLTETESELLSDTAGSVRDRLEGAAKNTVEGIKETADEFLEKVADVGTDPAAAARSGK